MLDLIIPFAIGAAFGLYIYSSGWRAQSPFYKEDSSDGK